MNNQENKVCRCRALWYVHAIRGTRVWQHFVLAVAIEGSPPSRPAEPASTTPCHALHRPNTAWNGQSPTTKPFAVRSTEKQAAIRSQIDSLLALGVILESRASYWSQLHMVRKPIPGEWRMTLDFVQLNAATRGLECWPIPNIQQTLARLGTLKPKLFGLLDFTAGYYQTPLDPASRAYTASKRPEDSTSGLELTWD